VEGQETVLNAAGLEGGLTVTAPTGNGSVINAQVEAVRVSMASDVPTATQKVVVTQDTLVNSGSPPVFPAGSGGDWTVHVDPESMTRLGVPATLLVVPTATHHIVDTHDTPRSRPGTGRSDVSNVVVEVHDVPDNVSTRPTPPALPTATQAEGAVHETASRLAAALAPAGGGRAVYVHVDPTNVATRGRLGEPWPIVYDPTAVHAVAETHDTPDSCAPDQPGARGNVS